MKNQKESLENYIYNNIIDNINIEKIINNSINKNNQQTKPNQLFQHYLHYDTLEEINELLVLTGDTTQNEVNILGSFPLFFESQNSRFIPNKVKRAIEWYCSTPLLNQVHEDKDIAIELCLIFLANLSNAFYNTNEGWKSLQSKMLQEQVSLKKDNTYKKIIDVLLVGTKKDGPIIEINKQYKVGEFSREYRLTEKYRDKGVKKYDFETTYAKNLLSKNYFKQLDKAYSNPIANNLIKIYKSIELPTIFEIKKEAKRLIKEGYKTKKGKILTLQNKHSKDYWKDSKSRSFVEDNIELFKRLTEHGYLIPTVSEENAGGRVTDSFNLMPSWIRNLIKINGRKIIEADYTALHPNIAMKIYGGIEKYITHEKVAEDLNIEVKKVKIQHLSFFNHEWKNIMRSPLFNYYKKDNVFMSNMHNDKVINYKITTKKMFEMEVKIMTSVIKKLNEENIYVMYVYDALYTCQKNINRVKEVMNEEIIKQDVYTLVK